MTRILQMGILMMELDRILTGSCHKRDLKQRMPMMDIVMMRMMDILMIVQKRPFKAEDMTIVMDTIAKPKQMQFMTTATDTTIPSLLKIKFQPTTNNPNGPNQ